MIIWSFGNFQDCLTMYVEITCDYFEFNIWRQLQYKFLDFHEQACNCTNISIVNAVLEQKKVISCWICLLKKKEAAFCDELWVYNIIEFIFFKSVFRITFGYLFPIGHGQQGKLPFCFCSCILFCISEFLEVWKTKGKDEQSGCVCFFLRN